MCVEKESRYFSERKKWEDREKQTGRNAVSVDQLPQVYQLVIRWWVQNATHYNENCSTFMWFKVLLAWILRQSVKVNNGTLWAQPNS